jgi:hypothetical protein
MGYQPHVAIVFGVRCMTRALESLPPAAQLLQRRKALACLDAILCADWESRYYSFNARRAPNEQMASMRNGCGDEWYSTALQAAVPSTMPRFSTQAAFSWQHTTFVYVAETLHATPHRLYGKTCIDAFENGAVEFLVHLTGNTERYVAHAAEYFEAKIDLALVEHVFALKPLTAELVTALGSERSLDELANDVNEIDYPMT